MQKKDVQVGKTYVVRVSGIMARVRLERENLNGGWDGVNEATGRQVRVRTAARLRMPVSEPKTIVKGNCAETENFTAVLHERLRLLIQFRRKGSEDTWTDCPELSYLPSERSLAEQRVREMNETGDGFYEHRLNG